MTGTFVFRINAKRNITYSRKTEYINKLINTQRYTDQRINDETKAILSSAYDDKWSRKYKDNRGQVEQTSMDIMLNYAQQIIDKDYRYNETFQEPKKERYQGFVTVLIDHGKTMVKLPFQYHAIDQRLLFVQCTLNNTLILHVHENFDKSGTHAGGSLIRYLETPQNTSTTMARS